jgi:tetratricopeptide (TPR) repeat protein
MKRSHALIPLLLILGAISCSRDPEVVKRRYVESGNRYFQHKKYKEASIMYRNALKKDMKYGEAYYRLGLTQLELRQYGGAVGSFRRAIDTLDEKKEPRLHPIVDDAITKLSTLYRDIYVTAPPTKRPQLRPDIEALAAKALKRNPKSFDGLRLQGYLAWMDQNIKEAIGKFQAANEVKPLDPDLILAYFQVLAADKQLEAAEKLALACIEKNKGYGPIYDLLYTHYLRQNRLQDAENIRKVKVENNPKQAEFIKQLARHYYMLRRKEECDRVLQRILSNPQDFPDGQREVGDFYAQIREFDKAMEHYRAGLKAGGKQEIAFRRKIADMLIARGRKQEAAQLLDQILKEHPKDPQASALRASLLLESGKKKDIDTALEELEASVSRMPENFVVRFNLGRAYWANGDIERAREQFEQAVNLRADYLAPRLALGQIHLLKGEFAAALQSANEILAFNRSNLPALLLRAASLRGMKNYSQAQKELETLVKLNPKNKEILYQLGLLYISQREFKAAEDTFSRCSDLSSNDFQCLMALVDTYSAQQQYDKGMELLAETEKKMPGHSELRLALASTAVLAGKYDMAVPIYKDLINQNPKSGDLQLKLGETYRRAGKFDLAVEHFQKAKELTPQNPAVYIPLALMQHGLGHHEQAKSLYEQILKLQPDNVVALNNLAYVIAELGGNLDQALTYAQRAKQRLPEDLNVADTLGWIYIKKNLGRNAIEIYKEIVSKSPDNPTYRYHLGMALFQIGNKPEARKELQSALRNNPSKEEAQKIKALMAKIG